MYFSPLKISIVKSIKVDMWLNYVLLFFQEDDGVKFEYEVYERRTQE